MDKVDQSFESINDPDAKECSIVDSTEIKKINYKTYTNLLCTNLYNIIIFSSQAPKNREERSRRGK